MSDTTAPSTGGPVSRAGMTRDNWGWFLALGVLFILGGIFALAAPIIASVTAAILIGAALIVVGLFQIFHSFRVRSWGTFLWELLLGAIMVIGGGAIAYNPILGAVTLTWVLAVVWIAKGAAQLLFGFRLRPHSGWGWVVAAGVLSVAVGIFVLLGWPFTGLYVPGTLIGISLLFTGWSYLMLSTAARRLR